MIIGHRHFNFPDSKTGDPIIGEMYTAVTPENNYMEFSGPDTNGVPTFKVHNGTMKFDGAKSVDVDISISLNPVTGKPKFKLVVKSALEQEFEQKAAFNAEEDGD